MYECIGMNFICWNIYKVFLKFVNLFDGDKNNNYELVEFKI